MYSVVGLLVDFHRENLIVVALKNKSCEAYLKLASEKGTVGPTSFDVNYSHTGHNAQECEFIVKLPEPS